MISGELENRPNLHRSCYTHAYRVMYFHYTEQQQVGEDPHQGGISPVLSDSEQRMNECQSRITVLSFGTGPQPASTGLFGTTTSYQMAGTACDSKTFDLGQAQPLQRPSGLSCSKYLYKMN